MSRKKWQIAALVVVIVLATLVANQFFQHLYVYWLESQSKVPTKKDAVAYFESVVLGEIGKYEMMGGPFDFNESNSQTKVFIYSFGNYEQTREAYVKTIKTDTAFIICNSVQMLNDPYPSEKTAEDKSLQIICTHYIVKDQ